LRYYLNKSSELTQCYCSSSSKKWF